MANVLNRITREYRLSVNTPDYNPAEWLINPDLSRVIGLASKYWVIGSDDVVRPMSSEERAALDAAAVSHPISSPMASYPVTLSDGTPAFRLTSGQVVSINSHRVSWSLDTGAALGSKTFRLRQSGQTSSDRGLVLSQKVAVTVALASTGSLSKANTLFELFELESGNPVFQLVLPTNKDRELFESTPVVLPTGVALGVRVSSTEPVHNPAFVAELNRID